MIIHAQVFEINYKQSVADYTLPYQTNHDLDYDFIAQKCEKLIAEMEDFDDKTHLMDSKEHKGLLYYFKYVKKNLILIAAIDRDSGLYEEQHTEIFEKLHDSV